MGWISEVIFGFGRVLLGYIGILEPKKIEVIDEKKGALTTRTESEHMSDLGLLPAKGNNKIRGSSGGTTGSDSTRPTN